MPTYRTMMLLKHLRPHMDAPQKKNSIKRDAIQQVAALIADEKFEGAKVFFQLAKHPTNMDASGTTVGYENHTFENLARFNKWVAKP
jgi:hypothetical protein